MERGASSEWTMKKAAISVAFCGGLSINDLRELKLGNLEVSERGVWVKPPKDEEDVVAREDDGFLVPFCPSKVQVQPNQSGQRLHLIRFHCCTKLPEQEQLRNSQNLSERLYCMTGRPVFPTCHFINLKPH